MMHDRITCHQGHLTSWRSELLFMQRHGQGVSEPSRHAMALGSASTTPHLSNQKHSTWALPTSTRQSLGKTFTRNYPLAACRGHSWMDRLSPPYILTGLGWSRKGITQGVEANHRPLFSPNQSINNGIDPSLCSLSFISVDQVADIATQHGRGALLAKVDNESAYMFIPVHPQDRPCKQ